MTSTISGKPLTAVVAELVNRVPLHADDLFDETRGSHIALSEDKLYATIGNGHIRVHRLSDGARVGAWRTPPGTQVWGLASDDDLLHIGLRGRFKLLPRDTILVQGVNEKADGLVQYDAESPSVQALLSDLQYAYGVVRVPVNETPDTLYLDGMTNRLVIRDHLPGMHLGSSRLAVELKDVYGPQVLFCERAIIDGKTAAADRLRMELAEGNEWYDSLHPMVDRFASNGVGVFWRPAGADQFKQAPMVKVHGDLAASTARNNEEIIGIARHKDRVHVLYGECIGKKLFQYGKVIRPAELFTYKLSSAE